MRLTIADDDAQIPLAAAIRALRKELVEAVREGEGEEVHFSLGPVELELQVEVAKSVGGKAGIAFWLVSIGAGGSRDSASTQTVKLHLTPVNADGKGPVLVRSQVDGLPD